MDQILVTVAVDTEEDDWGSYARQGATVRNVRHVPLVQELFDRHGVRPTYLVNSPPLQDPDAVEVLGRLAEREDVEIGAHCHPWNTPPFRDDEAGESMMWRLPLESNRRKVGEVKATIERELGVRPISFRTGRWSFGESVARALADHEFLVDASVTPFLDWSHDGGPDYGEAPHQPYRFRPSAPLHPDPEGTLVELPTTVGFLRGDPVRAARIRRALEDSLLAKLRVVGLLDRLGILRRRWLSPEWSSAEELVRLADNSVAACQRVLAMTFHSPSLLPGATPVVEDEDDRRRFLGAIDRFLRHCSKRGWRFATLGEVGHEVYSDDSVARTMHPPAAAEASRNS